jgi:UDP-N-acetylglucosamine 2-epimerase (non-hydrolysing)
MKKKGEKIMKKILFIYGTRPEAIKLAPLILEFRKHSDLFDVKVCLTGQHRQMLDQINNFFGIIGDYDLDIMVPNQTLAGLTSRCINGLDKIFPEVKPDYIFVQGDTTTVMAASLVAYYYNIEVVHIEAGLRSGNKYSPFPEEINRIIAGHIASMHFAPTERAKQNLIKENINNNIYVVGNTVIDALLLGLEIIKKDEKKYKEYFSFIDFSKKIILVTGHRRESFGISFENMCLAIKDIAEKFEDVEIVYPVHLNPNVQKPVRELLHNISRIHLIEPIDYPYMIWLMSKAYFVITDSGGVQEEAPALGKPVLVTREVTERQEGVDAGTAVLVGTDREKIFNEASSLLKNQDIYMRMSKAVNPYGNGDTSYNILKIFLDNIKS